MKIKAYYADLQVGIWNTEMKLRVYKDKAILRLPYIKWQGQNGSLDFEKYRITDTKEISILKNLFTIYDDDPLPLRERLEYLYCY